MDQVRQRFEEYVDDLRATMRAGAVTGTDGERARQEAEELIVEYRSKLKVEESPVRAQELLAEFRRQAERL